MLPLCSACGGPTRLTRVEPHPTAAATDLRTFECQECGEQKTFLVCRKRYD
jgi:hypothetical protein